MICMRIRRVVWIFHPHQRCGKSDSPFARIHYFYTAGPGSGLEGVVSGCPQTDNGLTTHLKKNIFSILRRPQAQARARPRAQARAPAKKDGKYKLAATKIVKNVSIYTQNHQNQGFNFLDVRKIDVFPPEANTSLLASKF